MENNDRILKPRKKSANVCKMFNSLHLLNMYSLKMNTMISNFEVVYSFVSLRVFGLRTVLDVPRIWSRLSVEKSNLCPLR